MNGDGRFLVQLTDPAGFDHRLEFFEGRWYGAENIAHVFPDRATRERVSERIMSLVGVAPYGNFAGYIWRRAAQPDYSPNTN